MFCHLSLAVVARQNSESSCHCGNPKWHMLVAGVMDLRAMAVVAAAITVERLAPAGERVAQTIADGRLTETEVPKQIYGGSDGTRTRGLCRDSGD